MKRRFDTPEEEVAHYLARLAGIWILTVLALLIIATLKAS